MAIEPLKVTDTPSEVVYFVILNSDGDFFDFDDESFKALADAVEPELAATEDSDAGGIGESAYSADLDLALINNGPVVGVYTIQAMQRLGGSPDPETDMMIATAELRIANGMLSPFADAGELAPGYSVQLGMNVTNEEGSAVQCFAWVEFSGQPVELGEEDTCSFDCFPFGSDISQFDGPTPADTPGLNGNFEATVEDPEMASGTNYKLTAVVVFQGVTLHGQKCLPMIG